MPRALLDAVAKEQPPADLAVDGRDLIELGYREGPAIGAALARLLDEVIDDPAANEREHLLAEAGEWRR